MTTDLPDFKAMTDAEKIDWLDDNIHLIDTVAGPAVYRPAGSSPYQYAGPGDGRNPEVLQVTTIRLPVAVITELDEKYGNTKGGRSGFIRDAIEEKLRRDEAA